MRTMTMLTSAYRAIKTQCWDIILRYVNKTIYGKISILPFSMNIGVTDYPPLASRLLQLSHKLELSNNKKQDLKSETPRCRS